MLLLMKNKIKNILCWRSSVMKRQHPAPLSAVQWANKLVFRLLPEERKNKVSWMLILLFQWGKISNRHVANNKTFEKADLGRVHCSFVTGMNSYFASFFFFFSKSFWGWCGSLSICSGNWRVFWAGFAVLEPSLKGTESTRLHFPVVRLVCGWCWSKLVTMQVLLRCTRLILPLAFILILSSVRGKTQ